MFNKIIFVVALTVIIIGCAKKEEAMNSPYDLPEMMNQAIVTQTNLALMSETKAGNGPAGTINSPQSNQSAPPPDPSARSVPITNPTSEDIQKALKNANLYAGKIDGEIGPKTKKAIRTFQEQNGLKADGKVGSKTWAKLQPFLTQGFSPEVEMTGVEE